MSLIRLPRPTSAGGCRRCPVSCDKVVYPGGCLEAGCTRLYAYEDGGRTWVGCLEKVFAVEVDLAAIRSAEGRRGGFGGLRVMREPLAVCRCGVDPTFAHRTDGTCRNPGFLFSAPQVPAAPAPPPADA